MNRQSTAWGIPIYLCDRMPVNKILVVTNHGRNRRSSMADSRKKNQREILRVLIVRFRALETDEMGPSAVRNLSRDEIYPNVSEDMSLGDVHLAIEDLERGGLIDRHQVRGINAPPRFRVKEAIVKHQDLLASVGGLGCGDHTRGKATS